MNFTGYFLLGSKFGGLTMKPSTLSPYAPVNQKGSRGDMEMWERRESLRCVSRVEGLGDSRGILPPSGRRVSPGQRLASLSHGAAEVGRDQIAFGNSTAILVKSNCFPSGVTTRSSLYPPEILVGTSAEIPASPEPMLTQYMGASPLCSAEK